MPLSGIHSSTPLRTFQCQSLIHVIKVHKLQLSDNQIYKTITGDKKCTIENALHYYSYMRIEYCINGSASCELQDIFASDNTDSKVCIPPKLHIDRVLLNYLIK